MTTTIIPDTPALPSARHGVRIGHTTFTAAPIPVPMAVCCGDGTCEFHAEDRIREAGVHHAQEAGHVVLVGQGSTVTVIEVTS